MSSLRRPLAFAIAMAVAAASVLGCDESPPPKVMRLEVAASGAYTLDGRLLSEAELTEAFAAMRGLTASVELEIHAPPEASYQSVGKAVTLAQSQRLARIRLVQSDVSGLK